jgi:hypothetical protein
LNQVERFFALITERMIPPRHIPAQRNWRKLSTTGRQTGAATQARSFGKRPPTSFSTRSGAVNNYLDRRLVSPSRLFEEFPPNNCSEFPKIFPI